MFKPIDNKKKLSELEHGILEFWKENKVFEKSVENRKDGKLYSFYEGPPFATGTPHYGHLVASAMKDVVPRYWTMRGFFVERKWGWDCHGLPIENIAEKELGIKHKKEIEKMGVEKFNEICRSKVLTYIKEWEIVIEKLGRWADMKNCYKTMDLEFMESVWWVFKELWDKGLIYESYRSMHICPRCETTLSQSEVAEGYKDVKDLSVIAKFELEDEPGTFVLAWTTTPWTLPGNAALAVRKDIKYLKIKLSVDCHPERPKGVEGSFNQKREINYYVLAKEKIEDIFKDQKVEIIEELKGKDLIGKKYKPLFDYYSNQKNLENRENGWKIYGADFVTTEDGTGVVHIAPAFGEDDLNLGKKEKLPFIQHVGMDGIIKEEAKDFAGLSVKPKDDPQKTDIEIIKYLAEKNLLFKKEKYEHSYPHCWRCDTPLLNYAASSWFVSIEKIKDEMLQLAKNINWVPKYIKEGRFGNWLEGARDWSISRQRYWASVMPIWKCEGGDCDNIKVFGSVKELEDVSGEKITDLHKHVIDKITFKCEKCGKTMKRIPDVLDTWFDSGSMPYAQAHYPFENKEKFDSGFPAEFIAEGIDQTRCWFYYLHAISTAIKNSESYKNVIVNGIVLAEDGKKMSKRLQNYPNPIEVLEKYGADSLRYYLLSSPVVSAENLNFKESDVADVARGIIRMLLNSYAFFVTYANVDQWKNKGSKLENRSLLDNWIISELNILIKEVNAAMEKYELNKAARPFQKFIDNLSNWYIRRSRRRFWKSEDDSDKNSAYQTLYTVLLELSKLMAPFTPFISEMIYRNLKTESIEISHELNTEIVSVHLEDYPAADESLIDEKLNDQMEKVRKIVEMGLAARAKAGIKVRQPLNELLANGVNELPKELIDLIRDEVNVKELRITNYELRDSLVEIIDNDIRIAIDTEITEDLQAEGMAREIVRMIQQERKNAGFDVSDRILVSWFSEDEFIKKAFSNFRDYIMREVLAEKMDNNLKDGIEIKTENRTWQLTIKKK